MSAVPFVAKSRHPWVAGGESVIVLAILAGDTGPVAVIAQRDGKIDHVEVADLTWEAHPTSWPIPEAWRDEP